MTEDKDKTIDALKAALEKARTREEDYRASRRAMLFMLEDLNDSFASIKKAGREWADTFDAITDPLFIHDEQLNIVRANRAYGELAGMSLKELLGRRYYTVFPLMSAPFAQCLKAKEQGFEKWDSDREEEITVPGLERTFKVRYYPVRDEKGGYLYSIHIMEDITAAKKAEARLRQEIDVTANLLSIAEATARTKEIDKLMDEVVRCAARIFRADACLSYLKVRAVKGFAPSQSYGLPALDAPLFRTETLEEPIWFVKEPLGKKDFIIAHGPFEAPGEPLETLLSGHSTVLLIPLIGMSGAIGLLINLYKARTDFTETDMRVINGVKNQVTSALEEARLYEESVERSLDLSHKIETIKVMHEIDKSILSTLESAEILDTSVRFLARLVPCDRATVARVDRGGGGFIYQAGFGTNLQKGAFVPFSDTSASEVVDTGRSQFTPDLFAEERLLPLEKRFLEEGFLSHLRVPLIVKGETVAVLSVGAKRVGVFTREDLSTLESLAYQIGIALENSRLLTDLKELFLSTIKALSNAIDAKSPWTRGHSERVTDFSVAIGKELGLSDAELKKIELAGLLHDIGKLGTYEAVLNKPGRLTEEEMADMRQHPPKGADILEPIKQLKDITPGIKYHHEFYDGSGYPEGLKGDAIPLMARILTVADTVDAMSADRPYRKGRDMEAIIAELKRCSGTQFDPKTVEAFLRAVGSGKIGIWARGAKPEGAGNG